MAFDEDDLRAALRADEGAGLGVDAGTVIALAEARLQARHARVRMLAAAVVVLGAVGTGIGVLATHGRGDESATSAAGGKFAPEHAHSQAAPGADTAGGQSSVTGTAAAGGTSGGLAVPGPASSAHAGRCPARPVRVRQPAAGAAGAAAPLFTARVASIAVCGYASTTPNGAVTLTGSRVLSGTRARQLAAGLDAASARVHTDFCVLARTRVLVLYAVSTARHRLEPVRVELSGGCGVTATNGTAIRYDWSPPSDLAALTD